MTNEFSDAFSTAFDATDVVAPCDCTDCVPYPICTDCCPGWGLNEETVRCRATALAWAALKTLTAGRVGNCPVTIRPCLSSPCDACSSDGSWLNPVPVGGGWYNAVCGGSQCSCERMCEIVLPGPVAEVLEVQMDGAVLDNSLFRLDNGNRLVRQDRECWPSCQQLGDPLGAPCTLGITYVPGIKPGAAGEWAAGMLACEFAKACLGGKCRLPSSVTSIVRNGTAMEFATGLFQNNVTGIREVDAFVLSVNPHGLRTPAMVWSPDLEPALHRYSTGVS